MSALGGGALPAFLRSRRLVTAWILVVPVLLAVAACGLICSLDADQHAAAPAPSASDPRAPAPPGRR